MIHCLNRKMLDSSFRCNLFTIFSTYRSYQFTHPGGEVVPGHWYNSFLDTNAMNCV